MVRLRPYKPGKYGKGMLASEQNPQVKTWRISGGWNGEPHHAEVADLLGSGKPEIAFHIDKQRRFYFHQEDPDALHPKSPAKLAEAIRPQLPGLSWGGMSVEEHERRQGIRDGKPKTLAMNGRPLRPFEQGAHLHVLDWAHTTARYRLQAAGQAQIKAAAQAVVRHGLDGPPSLPALEAAMSMELRKLWALGHATVRSELDHQREGNALPVGLSKAPHPPNLRQATTAKERCGTCHMFDNGVCWGYGNYGVEPDEVCDSWAPESGAKTLAQDQPPDPHSLRARARLIAADAAHRLYQAVHRARLSGISEKRTLLKVGEDAGAQALAEAATRHAGAAINGGRLTAAQAAEVVGARYTAVLDKNSCGPCADADTGELIPLSDPRWIPTPNPACLGGDRCRCIHVYQLIREAPSVPVAAAR